MSFRNTHTPTRAEIVGKARYQCPMHKVRGVNAYYLTPELEQHFRRLYPTTLNRDMMRLFGISFVTMQRFKRQLGLTKNMTTIRRKQAAIAKQICEQNGYYDSLRGKAPSEACIEASRQMFANGFHPMKALKRKSPRRYRRLMEQRSEKRKALWQKERSFGCIMALSSTPSSASPMRRIASGRPVSAIRQRRWAMCQATSPSRASGL